MRVSDFLSNEHFSNLTLLAGENGLDNVITTVTVVDTPDGAQWLKGGELVITTGFMLGNDESHLLDFLRRLNKCGVAALGIKEKRHIDHIPASARELANQLSIPLISIPEVYAFADIINPVLSNIIDQQHAELMQSSIIHKKFLEMAVNDRPIYDILESLSMIIGIPSAFLDTQFEKIYYSDTHSILAKQIKSIDPANVPTNLGEYLDYRVVSNQSTTYGYLIFPKNTIQSSANYYHNVAIEQATIVIILRMQVRISNKYIHESYKSAFVVDMMLNNIKSEKEIHNRAQLYNWDFHDGGIVAVVDINEIKKYFMEKLDSDTNRMLEKIVERIFDLAIQKFNLVFHSVKYMRQSDLIAFLITEPAEKRFDLDIRLRQVFDLIHEQLQSISNFTIIIGVGNYYNNIKDIHKSYSEARTSINLCYTLRWFDRLIFYKDIGLYRILISMQNIPEVQEYCDQYLTPLKEYDAENGQELMMTLYEIIQSDWNLKKAAENMYLHYNTMKYRYKRINTIIGLDLSQPVNRMMISLILTIHMIQANQLPDTQQYLNKP